MRISDWSSDVCSSDLFCEVGGAGGVQDRARGADQQAGAVGGEAILHHGLDIAALRADARDQQRHVADDRAHFAQLLRPGRADHPRAVAVVVPVAGDAFVAALVQIGMAAVWETGVPYGLYSV